MFENITVVVCCCPNCMDYQVHAVIQRVKCTTQKLQKFATPNSNIWFQTGFGDSNPSPEKKLNFASLKQTNSSSTLNDRVHHHLLLW